LSRAQWQGIDRLAGRYAERRLRITTRQTVQLHGMRKRDIQGPIHGLRDLGLDTVAACRGDTRGVQCGATPRIGAGPDEVARPARATSDRLIPRTGGYAEIWYGDKSAPTAQEEPVYGDLYLPRKFKVGFAIPPVNDIDVFGQDPGLIAIVDDGTLIGFN